MLYTNPDMVSHWHNATRGGRAALASLLLSQSAAAGPATPKFIGWTCVNAQPMAIFDARLFIDPAQDFYGEILPTGDIGYPLDHIVEAAILNSDPATLPEDAFDRAAIAEIQTAHKALFADPQSLCLAREMVGKLAYDPAG